MNSSTKDELLGKSMEELQEYMMEMGEPAFRGRQLFKWIYAKEINSFYDMSDLPRELRKELDLTARISIPRVLKQRVSADGTRKYLLELRDKKRIETVLIPQGQEKESRYTICVSTQVGCPIGCSFCATGQSGFQRNMECYEIIGQVLGSKREIKRKLRTDEENIITNVVYMGMGEPLLNYDEMIKSIHMLNHPKGVNIGQRHMTVSTSGEVNGIRRLAQEGLQVTLAVSLHACDDELRNQLVPLNRKYSLDTLKDAIEYYISETNRRVTFEYVMLDEVNISRRDAENMITLIKPLLANVNLIPYNEVVGLDFKKPSRHKIQQFYNWLMEGGINVTVRDEMGADIMAACGQLRSDPNIYRNKN
ncbi:ribosomal rna large subunit methyltransferase n [hydrocarbon metagenome]|uniref:Ribosomal rna large subunit methyltransferase n n=1 Tax=hydrocarbon metagenome TaxID=938273 RepID=A0A0W8E553_9ZZZZ